MTRPMARRLAWCATGLAVSVLIGALALAALATKEQDNNFCVACHLHEEKFSRFTAAAPTDLAGFHFQRKPEIGCIACHGGADARMWAKIRALAAYDTLRFLVGRYQEPTHMLLPLRDAECRQCHDPILRLAASALSTKAVDAAPSVDASLLANYGADPYAEGAAGTSYHTLRGHDGVNIRCVRCHTSHTTGGHLADQFISRPIVQPICRECHPHL